MRVFVIDVDNGFMYSDWDHQVESVHKSYRSATEYLLNKDFTSYPVKTKEGTYDLFFRSSNGVDSDVKAVILEFELKD